jgi:hypothetical protein
MGYRQFLQVPRTSCAKILRSHCFLTRFRQKIIRISARNSGVNPYFDLLRKTRRHEIVKSRIMQACTILVKAMMDKESENHIEEFGLSSNTISCRVLEITSQNDCYPCR